MARKIIQTYEIIDDLTGEAVDEGDAEEIFFAYKGTSYRIDLSKANARKLDDLLSPYVATAQRVSGGRGRPRGSGRGGGKSGYSKEELVNIREWATKNGHQVSARGRIPGKVIEAYVAAHAS